MYVLNLSSVILKRTKWHKTETTNKIDKAKRNQATTTTQKYTLNETTSQVMATTQMSPLELTTRETTKTYLITKDKELTILLPRLEIIQ